MSELKSIVTDIKNGQVKPIYFLMGEEPYYIDKISDFIEATILNDVEKSFNQTVLYGRDTSIEEIVSVAKRFPMMSEYQVVIVKEAQDLIRTIEKLVPYVQKPQRSTILVFNYKYKTIDKRKKLYKELLKVGLIFDSKKFYENKIPSWIAGVLKGKGYKIVPKASQMLVDFLGTDLSKISKELEKLTSILKKETIISPIHIEENIGISKDFNNFELLKAIGSKNVFKSNQIIHYFTENPKNNPLVLTITLLNSFFTRLLIYHGLPNKSKNEIAKSLGVSFYFIDDYVTAGNHFPLRKVAQIISFIRDADLKGKGIGASNVHQGAILKELLFKILH